MKVYILSDLEGVACVFSRREGYGNAMEYGTMELAEVCRKLLDHGVSEILINCLHPMEYHKFPQQVEFVHAEPTSDLLTSCLDDSFDMAMVTGMHAMAGGPDQGCWRHTLLPPPISQAYSSIAELRVNGVPIGEAGLFALFAGIRHVPVVYLSGDYWACEEIKRMIPGIETCAVKKGTNFYSAKSLHPLEAARQSAEAAVRALRLKGAAKPYEIDGSLEVQCRYTFANRAADAMKLVEGARRVDEYTVAAVYENALEFRKHLGCFRAPEDQLHQRDLGLSTVSGFLARTGVEPYEVGPGFSYPRQVDFALSNWK